MLSSNIRLAAAKALKVDKDDIKDDTNIIGFLKKDKVDLVAFIIDIEAQSGKKIDIKQVKKLKTIDDIQNYLNQI